MTPEPAVAARPQPSAAPSFLARVAASPVAGTAAVALAVRLAVVLDAWAVNPLVRRPQLDGNYYLQWASEIAAGDVVGRGGLVGGEPFFLNPLYAYVLAPILAAFGTNALLAALLLNVALGVGAAALAAAAARRFVDDRAAWATGILVACSAVLAQLDCHIAVSELAAFLAAGACFAMAPPREGSSGFGHGPVAAGLWLGVGALARPITPLVLPFAVWLVARRAAPGRRLRAAVVAVAVFFACAVPSLARNWSVSGDAALYTAASTINLHLGNNPVARAKRSMASPHFRFTPTQMHRDARVFVHEAIGHDPTREEVSRHFRQMVIREITNSPVESLVHYTHKFRWFFGPDELPSSASMFLDRQFDRALPLAWVPTWLIASLAMGGAWVLRRRRDILLGPGAVVLAHVVVLTAVFPLSHYRSPCVPALAILAGCGASAAAAAWTAGRRRDVVAPLALAAAFAVAGAVPPRPDPLTLRDGSSMAIHYRDENDFESAEKWVRWTLDRWAVQWPGEPEPAVAWAFLGEIRYGQKRYEEAIPLFEKAAALDPHDYEIKLNLSFAREKAGDIDGAIREARAVIARYPDLPDGHDRLGRILQRLPGHEAEAEAELRLAQRLGGGLLR